MRERYYYDSYNNLLRTEYYYATETIPDLITEFKYDLEKQGVFRNINLPYWLMTVFEEGFGLYSPNLVISEKDDQLEFAKYEWLNFQDNYPTQVNITYTGIDETKRIAAKTITYKEIN